MARWRATTRTPPASSPTCATTAWSSPAVHVLVLGAGGSARAVVYGLGRGRRGVDHHRQPHRGARPALAAALRPHLPNCPLHVAALPDDLAAHCSRRRLDRQLHLTGHDAQREGTSPWPETPGISAPPRSSTIWSITRAKHALLAQAQATAHTPSAASACWSGRVPSPSSAGPASAPRRRHAPGDWRVT